MTRTHRPALLAAAVATLALGCRGDRDGSSRAAASADSATDSAADGGTMIITSGADADILLPPLVMGVMGNQVVDIVFERLAEIGDDLNTIGDRGFRPELARSWRWAPDSLSIAFSLAPAARWHDGKPVTARDVRFTFDTYRNPAVGAQEQALLARIDSVTAPDSVTAVFWFHERYPEQFFDAVHHMRILPQHVLGGIAPAALRTAPAARQPVGSGQYRFVRWDAGSVIELVADTAHYRGRPHLDRILWTIAPSYDASSVKLFAGDADFLEFVRADKMHDLARAPNLVATHYPSLDEGFLQFNLHDRKARSRPHPVFGDRAVRRALAMAIDRRRVVANVFDSLAVVPVGPVTRAQSTWDSTIAQIPFDTAAAARALDSLGWRDANGDGVREKGGRQLRFSLIVPTSSAVRQQIGVLLQEQLRRVGARVDLEPLEFNLWLQRQSARDFDATIGAMRYDPSPATIRQMWSAASVRDADGSNYSGYASAAFDALVDSASSTYDPAASHDYYRRAYETIVQDAPAVWLYETVNYTAHHRRIHPVGLRADAWWARISEWSIPAAERIPRDRVGLVARVP